jgi:F1F0 ATPase subunit 2
MDEKRMSHWLSPFMPSGAPWALLLLIFVSGFLAGLGYFYAIWWSARALVFGSHGAALAMVLSFGRLALLAGLFILAARIGAMALLLMALGVLCARFVMIRRVTRESS